MRIHTTQNLNLLNNKISANKISFKDDKALAQFYESNYGQRVDEEASISFKAKNPKNLRDAKKIIDTVKKGLEDIKDKATPEVKKGDKFLLSSFFDACINLVNKNENVFQAVSAAIICIILRPLTIAALPTKKTEASKNNEKAQEKQENVAVNKAKKKTKERSVEKTNNIYAMCQSIASGIMGIVTAIIVTAPFKNGSDLVKKALHKFLNPEDIKKLYPWVDKAKLTGADGKVLPKSQWIDEIGNKFNDDIKNCLMLPEFRKLAEVSKETFEKVLNLDIDFAAQKGKSFNDIVTRDGKKLYEAIDDKAFQSLGIKVSENGFDDTQILFRDIDKEYLEKLVADSKGVNKFGDLDVSTVFGTNEKGEIFTKHFREWKNTVDGGSWIPDFDTLGVASEFEKTANSKPRISGAKRFDTRDNEYKFVAYQSNASVEGGLGTPITTDMVNADAINEGQMKFVTWLPDLIARVPVATATIWLIPKILKNVFGIEKVKQNKNTKNNDVQKLNNNVENKKVAFKSKPQEANSITINDGTGNNNQITFKAGTPKNPSKLTNFLAKYVGRPLLKSSMVRKAVDTINKIPGDSSEHYVVLGSFIQSGVYVSRTLKNKEMDEDRKKTLAINQILCFVIPTIAGYTVNKFLGKAVKKVGYRYSTLMKQRIADLKASGDAKKLEKATEINDKLGKNIKAVGSLSRLASFTLIYRYLTPVLVTPIANMLGDKHIANKKAKEEAVVAKA